MKAACIWDVLAHILSSSTCNKRNMEFSPQVSINKTNVSTEYSSLFLSSRCTVAFAQLDLLDTGVDVCARKANGVHVEFFKCDLHPWKDRSYLSRYMV